MPDPLIVTAQCDTDSYSLFDGLRRQYFPTLRNLIAAHLTLFHHLPGEELASIGERLENLCSATSPMQFAVTSTHFLGGGVALAVECAGLAALRDQLATGWRDWLTPQDRQGFRPHVTIQNKVSAKEARQTEAALQAVLPLRGQIPGLLLWHYRGGPWEAAGEYAFREPL